MSARRLPESVEKGLIYMCDIISYSLFFRFDMRTKQFKLAEKNYQSMKFRVVLGLQVIFLCRQIL